MEFQYGPILFIAYIDPGAGSMLLQFIIATIVGCGVYFRKSIKLLFTFLRNFFFKKKKK